MTKRRVKSKRGNNRKIQKKGEKIQKGGFELKPIGNIARGSNTGIEQGADPHNLSRATRVRVALFLSY